MPLAYAPVVRDKSQFAMWRPPRTRLLGLTPAGARDLVVDCFFHAQRETFARSRDAAGLASDDEKVRSTVVGAVRAVFHEVGGNFDAPTVEHVGEVVEALGRKAASWGTPPDVVTHHVAQLREMVRGLR